MRSSKFVTKRYKINLLLVLLLTAICRGPGAAEPLGPNLPEGILRAHGVELTQHALLVALENKDIEIRRAASDVLAKRWPRLAKTAIEKAIGKEPDGFTRVWMAEDLARLGAPAGRQALVKECNNTAEWGSIRVEAADVLSERFRDYSCIDSILSILRSDSDPRDTNAKEHALELVPRLMARLPSQQSHQLFELAIKSLNDPWPGVRTTASRMLAKIDDPAAVPGLEAAIAKERNENGRRMMMDDLQSLTRKPQKKQQQ